MRYIIHDKKYNFKFGFDTEMSIYIRTGIPDADGKDTGIDPFVASYPHLINVVRGIASMAKRGLCVKAGIGCSQSGLIIEQPNNFRTIAGQSMGCCNHLALCGMAAKAMPTAHCGEKSGQRFEQGSALAARCAVSIK